MRYLSAQRSFLLRRVVDDMVDEGGAEGAAELDSARQACTAQT